MTILSGAAAGGAAGAKAVLEARSIARRPTSSPFKFQE